MPEPTAFLAIEASQRDATVALRPRDGAPIERRAVPAPDDAHDHLLATIDAACAAQGIAPRDLRAIAVSVGPGGFTGLRVACATAKAIADATGAALVAVPSAHVVARGAVVDGRLAAGPVAVVLASKSGTAWCESIVVEDGWPRSLDAAVRDASAFAPAGAPVLADALLPDAFRARCRDAGSPVLAATWSADACLQLGERMLAAGTTTDPLLLAPVYARPPEAVTLWDARHGPAAR